MEASMCAVDGYRFVALIDGVTNLRACSLPALVAVVHALFGAFLLLGLLSQRRSEDSASVRHARILSTTHRLFTWMSGMLCLGFLVALMDPLLLWRRSGYQKFPVDEMVVISLQSFGWFVSFVAMNREETNGRVLYETYLKVWHSVALLLSLPAGLASALHGLEMSFDVFIVLTPTLMFLALVSAHFLTLNYKKNYRWLDAHVPSLKQPLLDGFHHEPLPYLSGYSNAGLLSRLTLSWTRGVLAVGYRRPIEIEDLPRMTHEDEAAYNYREFFVHWEKVKAETPVGSVPSLWRAIWATFWTTLVLKPLVSGVLWTSTSLLGPVMTYAIIRYLDKDEENRDLVQGCLLVVVMFLGRFIEPFAKQQLVFQSVRLGVRMWGALGSAIYNKSLRLSSTAKQDWSVGEITNVISSDMQKFLPLNNALVLCFLLPFQVAAAAIILFWVVGMSMLAGLSTLVIVISLNVGVVGMMRRFRVDYLKAKGDRLNTSVECFSNMKIIKLQSWDEMFLRKIEALRVTERGFVSKFMYSWACSIFVIWAAPVAVAIVTFSMMVWLGEPLDAGKVFTALTTFSVIKEPVQQFPDNVSNVVQMMVSVSRMRRFLCEDEIDVKGVERSESCDSHEDVVDISDATFTWDGTWDLLAVRNLTLRIPKGSCFAVCGSVGSGKSSLLLSVMGELQKLSGTAKLCGRVAYVAQTAWIQTKSVRDNILFGRPLDSARYAQAVRAAWLQPDLALMPHGDKTEIGERGINLSGGQKQRIQLARALYADADVYLLDDPFSAVDAHTASHLFQEYVRGALKDKTVLLVTHQVEFLQATDCILVMKDGAIVQSGRYDELAREGREFGSFVSALQDSLLSVTQAEQDASSEVDEKANEKNPLRKSESLKKTDANEADAVSDDVTFVGKEERQTGGVKADLVMMYAKKKFGSWVFYFLVALNVAAYGLQVGGDSWLANGAPIGRQATYVQIYALLTVGGVVVILVRSLFTAYWGVATAQAFFEDMLHSVLRAPLEFFDSTPQGRIISRSSSNQTCLDTELPNSVALLLFNMVGLMGTVMVTSYVTPPLLFLVIPLGLTLLQLRIYFSSSSQEIARVSQLCEAPVFLHLGETVAGVTTIRAFREQRRFAEINDQRLEEFQRAYFHFQGVISWFTFRMQMITAVLVSAVAFLIILLPSNFLGPGMAGLALTYSLGINAVIGGLMYNWALTEGRLVAVERIEQYSHLPSEAPLVVEDHRPPGGWPRIGKIEFLNLQFRYRPTTPLVLRGVTCVLEAREKVGVVGRTGSGKSTLIQALFRLVEPAGGTIEIDSIDITKIGLSDLRSRLSVIPQEPAIFEGSLRLNLDPFDQYTDVQLWETLEKCVMADTVRSKPEKLQAPMTQGGENWSVGQRQLLCLGRALLREATILVLDEATASVDITTDAMIQRTIRNNFGGCTILSVAHRIPSVIDSDRILVLDQGYLKENASPEVLLADRNSIFSKLVHEYTNRTGVPVS